ncbi:MAG TPA: MarR family transcriptional regulator [Solirubrobacteraceae bacterium]|nr:MarR family transcriptional regulator [Solirubrobacteraceae bacterium]
MTAHRLESASQPHTGHAPTRDLEPHEQLGLAFKAAMAAVRRLRGRETHRPGALSNAQYGLLFSLATGCAMSTRELGNAAALSPATVTQMLEGMESHGLVQRLRSAEDKRVVLTALTDQGRALVEQHRERVEPRWRASLSEFTPDQLATAAAVLNRLARHFDELYEATAEGTPPDRA